MVTSINEIGKSLGLKTIAEFIEDEQSVEKLKEIGVDMLQGYGIGVPVPFENILKCSYFH